MYPPYSRTLFDLLREQAERYPGHLAVITGDLQLSYADLLQRARQVAGALQGAGLRRGDRIGLLISNRIEWLALLFGAAALGITVVPFSTWSKPKELAFLIEDSAVQALFALAQLGDQSFADDLLEILPQLAQADPGNWHDTHFAQLRSVVLIGAQPAGSQPLRGALNYEGWLSAHPPLAGTLPPGDGARGGDAALILYTSGSTAYPKAVPLCHAAMIENGFNIGERQGLQPGERVLLSLPLFWSYGSANAACATFTHGGTLVLQERFEPAGALELIQRHAVNAIYTLPGMTAAMVSHPSFQRELTASLRTGLTIGSPQDVAAAADLLGAREICNVYGQTESYGNCCVSWHHWPLHRRMQVQGPPLPGVTVRIVDAETGVLQPAGQQGLIEVKGNLTPGYAGRSAVQNAEAFTADGFFRTGDMGCLTEQGDLQFAGRSTEMIKRAGINIAPAEVEELLQQHPAVALAGVTGLADAGKGEAIVAFVVTRPGAQVSAAELRSFCRANASSYKAPDRIELCAALPLTPTGKVLRQALRQMAAALPDDGTA